MDTRPAPVATVLDADLQLVAVIRAWSRLSDPARREITAAIASDLRPMSVSAVPMVEVGKTDLVYSGVVMQRLGISRHTLRAWEKAGRLGEAVRLHGSVYFHEADVAKLEGLPRGGRRRARSRSVEGDR